MSIPKEDERTPGRITETITFHFDDEEQQKRFHEILDNGPPSLAASVSSLREVLAKLATAAQRLSETKFDTIKKKNGRHVGVEADDGEKCWIVHSDEVFLLEGALEQARAALSGVTQPATSEPEVRIVTSHALPVPAWDRIATAVVKRVAELPDRSSPDGWPAAMLVTSEELHRIIMSEFDKEIG